MERTKQQACNELKYCECDFSMLYKGVKMIDGRIFTEGYYSDKGCFVLVFGKLFDENGDLYMEGEFSSGILNGFGRIYLEGNLFKEGHFKNGKLHGYGKEYAKGIICSEGEYEDGKLRGPGKKYSGGVLVAEGFYIRNKLNGPGKIYHGNKLWKEGNFVDDMLDGEGKIYLGEVLWKAGRFKCGELNGEGQIYSDGVINEEGHFAEGVLNGQGKKYLPNGIVLEGEFKEGELNGRGRILQSGQVYKEGEFINGTLKYGQLDRNASGDLEYDNYFDVMDDLMRFSSYDLIEEGHFEDGELNGFGKRYRDEYYEEGEYCEGRLNGVGKRVVDDVMMEEGLYKDGELVGYGKRYREGQLYEEGEYRNGELNGTGKRYMDNEIFEEGFFKDGELISGNAGTVDYSAASQSEINRLLSLKTVMNEDDVYIMTTLLKYIREFMTDYDIVVCSNLSTFSFWGEYEGIESMVYTVGIQNQQLVIGSDYDTEYLCASEEEEMLMDLLYRLNSNMTTSSYTYDGEIDQSTEVLARLIKHLSSVCAISSLRIHKITNVVGFHTDKSAYAICVKAESIQRPTNDDYVSALVKSAGSFYGHFSIDFSYLFFGPTESINH